MTNYIFGDAFTMHILHPETFQVPSNEELQKLKIGDYVKLAFQRIKPDPTLPEAEIMWVRITSIDEPNLVGVLDNDPAFFDDIMCGDIVHFEYRHIYGILE